MADSIWRDATDPNDPDDALVLLTRAGPYYRVIVDKVGKITWGAGIAEVDPDSENGWEVEGKAHTIGEAKKLAIAAVRERLAVTEHELGIIESEDRR